MPHIRSVNVGRPRVLPGAGTRPTGIVKTPVEGPVRLTDPGPRDVTGATGSGSGVEGDVIGNRKHHGGDHQAVYAFAREELDAWASEVGRDLPDGAFGENLTTEGIDVDGAVLGERWRVGDALLVVRAPRVPCRTFAAAMGEPRWVQRFARRGRTGAYLAVAEPGHVRAGDAIHVVDRPAHGVTVVDSFVITMFEHGRRAELEPARAHLHPEALAFLERG